MGCFSCGGCCRKYGIVTNNQLKGLQGLLEVLYNEERFLCKTETGKVTMETCIVTAKVQNSYENDRMEKDV